MGIDCTLYADRWAKGASDIEGLHLNAHVYLERDYGLWKKMGALNLREIPEGTEVRECRGYSFPDMDAEGWADFEEDFKETHGRRPTDKDMDATVYLHFRPEDGWVPAKELKGISTRGVSKFNKAAIDLFAALPANCPVIVFWS